MMLNRTDGELRLAAHTAAVTHINERGWWQGAGGRTSLRVRLARGLVALAARLERRAGGLASAEW
jgi:hypothetical protein